MARPGLTKHRKFLRVARALDSEAMALGCLEFLWEVAYQNGDDYLGDQLDVELAAHWKGEPGQLCRALLEAGGEGNRGFIEELPDRPGHYRVHDLFDHAPDYVSRRLAREMGRRAKGVTLSEVRAEAGRKGAEVTNSKRQQTDGKQTATGQQVAASNRQLAATPAPAPAPAPKESQNPSCDTSAQNADTPRGDGEKLAALLKDEILRNKPDAKITSKQVANWSLIADRMIRLDKRNEERIAAVIRWVQADDFWMSNALSMRSIRANFDALEMKAGARKRIGSSAAVGVHMPTATTEPVPKWLTPEPYDREPGEKMWEDAKPKVRDLLSTIDKPAFDSQLRPLPCLGLG